MREKKSKICLLGATFSTNNMGVSALTAGIIKSIHSKYKDVDICLLDYGKGTPEFHDFKIGESTIPVQIINLRFSKKIYLKNNIALLILISLLVKLIPSHRMRRRITSRNFYLRTIMESDFAASIAGGDSFSDIYGLARFFYVSLPQLLVILLGKRLILLPQTLGPFKGHMVKIIARFIISRTVVTYSRDLLGFHEVRNLMKSDEIPDHIKFCNDVGFVVDAIKPEKMDLDGLEARLNDNPFYVGINVSGLLFMGGYTKDNMFGLKTDYRELVNNVIRFFIQEKDCTVVLIPHVFGSQMHSESDAVIGEKLYRELKPLYGDKIYMVRGCYNQSEIKYIIGQCDFFIGSRMHACIAALSQYIPCVAIAYSRKFYGVFQTIEAESLVADPRKIEMQAILKMIETTYNRKELIHTQLKQTIPAAQTRVLGLFDDMI